MLWLLGRCRDLLLLNWSLRRVPLLRVVLIELLLILLLLLLLLLLVLILLQLEIILLQLLLVLLLPLRIRLWIARTLLRGRKRLRGRWLIQPERFADRVHHRTHRIAATATRRRTRWLLLLLRFLEVAFYPAVRSVTTV